MNKISIYIALCTAFFFIRCSKEIKLNLPVYETKMVLEFYLEDNKPLNCLLQESVNYTDTARFRLINNALVVLSHGGVNDTLFNSFNFDPLFQKIYNYHNDKIIRLKPDTDYEVCVKDSMGRELRGSTRLNQKVLVDSLVYNFNTSNKAAVGLIFTDDIRTKDYYRIVAFKDAPAVQENEVWDITFTDILFSGKQFSFFTGYAFNAGDTIMGRLYHLNEEHHLFTESVNNAQSSNGNPFGQPANIITNLTGGTGIFTTLTYDERKLIIR